MMRLMRPLPAGIGLVSQWFGEHPEWYARFGLAGHNGLDYGVDEGTPVLAAHEGVVQIGDDPDGYGLYVRVINGYAITLYAHLAEIVVSHGERVEAGRPLGLSGSTGYSTGPHLHFGLKWVRGRNPAYRDWVDPVPFRD